MATLGSQKLIKKSIHLQLIIIQSQANLSSNFLEFLRLAPLAELQLDLLIASLDEVPLDWLDGQCVQGAGTYSANDANVRLLAIPASRGRVTVLDPN